MTWPCPVQPGVGHFDPSVKVSKNRRAEREWRLISFCVTNSDQIGKVPAKEI